MEQPTKDLNFAEYQYRVSNFENFRIYSKSGRYHYFNFQKSFRFDCRFNVEILAAVCKEFKRELALSNEKVEIIADNQEELEQQRIVLDIKG